MSSLNVRRGKYGLYNGKLYRILSKSIYSKSGMIEICSTDEQDLKNGFINNDSEFITKKYGFTCTVEVPKNEITEAYEIKTHAVYKGLTLDIIGCREKDGKVFSILSTPYRLPYNPTGEQLKTKNFLLENGFHDGQHEIDGCWYEIEVDMNDLELNLIEERTEIDISKL